MSWRAKQGPVFGENGIPKSLTRQGSGRKIHQLLNVEALIQGWVAAQTLELMEKKIRPILT